VQPDTAVVVVLVTVLVLVTLDVEVVTEVDVLTLYHKVSTVLQEFGELEVWRGLALLT